MVDGDRHRAQIKMGQTRIGHRRRAAIKMGKNNSRKPKIPGGKAPRKQVLSHLPPERIVRSPRVFARSSRVPPSRARARANARSSRTTRSKNSSSPTSRSVVVATRVGGRSTTLTFSRSKSAPEPGAVRSTCSNSSPSRRPPRGSTSSPLSKTEQSGPMLVLNHQQPTSTASVAVAVARPAWSPAWCQPPPRRPLSAVGRAESSRAHAVDQQQATPATGLGTVAGAQAFLVKTRRRTVLRLCQRSLRTSTEYCRTIRRLLVYTV